MHLTEQEIADWQPEGPPAQGVTPMQRAAERLRRAGQWHPAQTMGRRFPIGCVALEITQRCNLDCTLCYLSEQSEAVHDLPLVEIYRRIDVIRATYGPDTDVQVTGGDPTLRARAELLAIVRRIAERGMRPALFTNGIRATRELLAELAAAGLVDVAFHVDTTQQRKGMRTEADLNVIRAEYIARARGLGLSVLFNTTVHRGNFADIPRLIRFFVGHADVVRLASFQMQAETGRGIAGGRPDALTIDRLAAAIGDGAGAPIRFDTPAIGHRECNRYAMTLVTNGRVYDLFDNVPLITDILIRSARVRFDRTRPRRALGALVAWLCRHPAVLMRAAPWLTRKAWKMRSDLWAARGRAHKLSFFIHNFMDARGLERDRLDACSFMVATADGPISMCLHNARRDSFILKPVGIETAQGVRNWHPLNGTFEGEPAKQRRILPKGQAAAANTASSFGRPADR